MTYKEFIAAKTNFDSRMGFDVPMSEIHPLLREHQPPIVRWALTGGRRGIFAAFGLGKTLMQLEIQRQVGLKEKGMQIIVAPLGVRQEFKIDAAKIGMGIKFIRRDSEVEGDGLYLTNYESIRDGRLSVKHFNSASLDEASVLRSYGSDTFQSFMGLFPSVKYRFVATAAPSPNRYKELIHYAGFLGIMDTGQALTRFFQRDSTKTGNLTLYEHKEKEFWMWLSSWAIFLQHPKDLCRCSCHQENSYRASDSENLLSKSGSRTQSVTEPGSANVIADSFIPQHQATSHQEESSVADACAQNMAGKEQKLTPFGEASLTVAPERTTIVGNTMEVEEYLFVGGGENSKTLSQTWDYPQKTEPLNEGTTLAITSPEIAIGPTGQNKHETPEEVFSLPSKEGHNLSPHGPKNSASTTGSSTADTKQAGAQIESSTICHSCSCDEYTLPKLHVHYHTVVTNREPGVDRDGQFQLVESTTSLSLVGASKMKQSTIPARVEMMQSILAAHPDESCIIWHDLEAERKAIKKAVPEVVDIHGAMDLDEREGRVIAFSNGEIQLFASKPVLSGSGCNFQRHCNMAIFLGVGFKFNDFYQSIHRIYRFLQEKECHIHIIYADTEIKILDVLKSKWEQHEIMVNKMSEIIRKYGLSTAEMLEDLRRSTGVKRVEVRGESFVAANNDCVDECRSMETESVDLIHTSIPFSNHYEYTPNFCDFGHTDSNDHFWQQMDFLTPELLRILKPGRIYACHVKDRILFGSVHGTGAPTVSPFHAEALFHGKNHGFDYMGMITVVTDVVRENNQTYRLGWTEQRKDGSRMGVGSPEYILIFRKPQTDRTKGYADVRVEKDKDEYTRARWQIDAHAFWRSSGDRLVMQEEIAALPPDSIPKAFTQWSLSDVYDYEAHVRIGEALELRGTLPAKFMAIAPGSHHPDVWHDVNRMRTLNGDQKRKNLTMHVCPLQFDIVDRIITRFTNPNELVFDPFAGIMTVPYRAIKLGRRGRGVELSTDYFTDGVKYLRAAEEERSAPSLFDFCEV